MVSGLVTSPCDHERILSGDARLIRMASKSLVNELRESKDGLIFPFGVSFQLPASSYQLRLLPGPPPATRWRLELAALSCSTPLPGPVRPRAAPPARRASSSSSSARRRGTAPGARG